MVGELIGHQFDVGLSVARVGRLLRTLGLSPQRPLHRAWQQDPEAVARWKQQEYPTKWDSTSPMRALPSMSSPLCGHWRTASSASGTPRMRSRRVW
jgi:hypothetical protein